MPTFINTGVGGNNPDRVKIKTVATLNSQNIPANTSNITIKVYGYYDYTQYTPPNPTEGSQYIEVEGVRRYSGSFNTDFTGTSASKPQFLMEWTGTIDHTSTGAKTINIKVYQDTPNVTTMDYLYGNNKWALPTIPRGSEIISFPNFSLDSTVTASAPRKSTSFTNTFELKVGSKLIKSSGAISADSYTFSNADLQSIYTTIPNSSSATCTLYVTTKSGSTQIDTVSTATCTATVPSSVIPTFSSISATETVASLSGLGVYIQNMSKPRFTISGASGAKSSTISAYEIKFAGNTYTANNTIGGVYNITGSYSAVARVRDSRGRWSASKSITLTFYSGSSTISLPNFTIGNGVTVTVTPESSAYSSKIKHTVWLYLAGTHVVIRNDVGTSTTFTEAQMITMYDLLPTTTSGTVTAYVSTFYNGTQIGKQLTRTCTASIGSNVVPTVSSITTSETVSSITALGLPANNYVQNISKVKFTVNGASVTRGAKLSAYEIMFNGTKYTSNNSVSPTLNIAKTSKATARIMDSRGRWSSQVSVDVVFHAYSKPVLKTFVGFRTGGKTTTTNDILGWYYRTTYSASISSVNAKNQLSYKFEYKLKSDSSYTNIRSASLTLGTTTYASTENFGTGTSYFDPTKSYDFRFVISDKLGNSASLKLDISSGIVPASFGRDGIGAGKIWERGALDIGGDIYQNGNKIIDTGSNSNGNWIRFSDGTQICYGNVSFSLPSGWVNSSTVIWRGSGNLSQTYSQPFTSPPAVSFKTEIGEELNCALRTNTNTLFTWRLTLLQESEPPTSTDKLLSYSAIGRWK